MTLASSTPQTPVARRTLTELIGREAERRTRRRTMRWAGLIAVALLAEAAYIAFRPKPLPLSARYRTEAVTQGPVVREVRATGRVEALVTVQVGAEISGRIATVEVDYNQEVQQGQVLARFDRAALEAQLAQTQAAMTAAQVQLEQAKTERAQTDVNRARSRRLYEQHAVSDADQDAIDANARLAEQRVQAAESQLAAQRATYTLSRTNLDHAVIRSPIDGVVITRNIDPGQTVASVLQAPTLFSVAADLRSMRVIAAVDEADIGEVKLKQFATFTVNAYPDTTFVGEVVEIRNSPSVVQEVVTYGAVIETTNFNLTLKPGMTASARIQTAKVTNALRVPNAALDFTPAGYERHREPGLWTLSDQALHFVPVEPRVTDGELTAVFAKDLPVGTPVIVDLTPEGRAAHP